VTTPHSSGEVTGLDHAAAVAAIQNLLDVHRFADARARAAALLREQPDDPQVLCLLAQALLGVGDHASALQAAQRAIAASPEEEWGHRLASSAYAELARPRLARDAARRATALAPHLWEAWVQLAAAAHVVAWPAHEARHAATEALRLAPHEAEPHVAYGTTVMRGDPARARSAFEEALRLDPGNTAALNNLAVLDFRTVKLRRAGEGLVRAAAADPRDTVAQYNLRVTVQAVIARTCVAVTAVAIVLAKPLFFLGKAADRIPTPFTIIWIVAEALALGFLAWWLRRLTPTLRRHLWYLVSRHAMLRVLVAGLVVVGVLSTVGVVTSGPVALTTRILTLLVVIAVRVLTGISARRLLDEPTG
jgi:tetratricopeptide (TPR) repeat protein